MPYQWMPHSQKPFDTATTLQEQLCYYGGYPSYFLHHKAIQINSVQSFLKVNFLLEITDHTSQQLIPQLLEPQKPPPSSFYHENPNQGTLLWPQQPSPGRSAWKQWQEVITWIYAQTDGLTLQQPLGPWLHKFDHSYQ